MCKVLKNFTEGKQRNLGLILAIFTRFLRQQFNTPTDVYMQSAQNNNPQNINYV